MADEGDDGVIDQMEENSNKKTTYFVVDGSKRMFEDDPSGEPYGKDCSFARAINAIYSFCVRLCVTEEALRHLVGVLVVNTTFTETDPEIAMGAENMKHIFPIGVLDKERVLELEGLVNGGDLENLFAELFGGHTTCNYQKMASYSKLNISYSSGTARRFTSWVHFTNQVNPFGENFKNHDEYRRMLRNLHDIEGRKPNELDTLRRPLRGKCSIFVLGDSNKLDDSDLTMWRTVDEDADIYDKDFETLIFKRTGALRAHSIVPFSLGPNLEFNVAVYSVIGQKTKPTPFAVHAKTGLPIKSVTTYKAEDDGQEEEQKDGALQDNSMLPPPGVPLQRHQLSNVRNVGGVKVVISQGERDLFYRYPKGLRLIEFCPLSKIDLWEHVRVPLSIRPHEMVHTGATSLYSHLFERMKKRQIAAICEYTGRANQKPRNVAIIPNEEQDPQEGLHEGLIVVELHDADDKLDIEKAFEEKLAPTEGEIWPAVNKKFVEAAKNLSTSIRKNKFTPTAYPNPHLQAFYTMLKREANLETPDNTSEKWKEAMVNEWDQIKPWFENSAIPASRIQKAQSAAQVFEEVGASATIKKPTPKRQKDDDEEKPAKKSKSDDNDGVNLKKLAQGGKLGSLTVALLKEYAGANKINFGSAKKKDDLIAAISTHYGI
ncbi:unnamed protein product, partial [Mesorhabditis belari]|uniref:Ku domain-containing protein n=1 Tax=Mesorhabditis belari TaxID=2138241 RepID=A0AAF3F7T6_9BILA